MAQQDSVNLDAQLGMRGIAQQASSATAAAIPQRKSRITAEAVASFIKRTIFLLIGLQVMAFGVAFSIKAGLGTSPITSMPYVMSLFLPITVGEALTAVTTFFVFLQIVILRRRFNPVQLLQLGVSVVFGAQNDLALWVLAPIAPHNYLQQWGLCLIGVVLVAVGVAFEVAAKVSAVPGEGLVLAICKAWPKLKFGYAKVGFDVTCVIIAIILSITQLGTIAGAREGTVAAAVCVGLIAKRIGPAFAKFEKRFLGPDPFVQDEEGVEANIERVESAEEMFEAVAHEVEEVAHEVEKGFVEVEHEVADELGHLGEKIEERLGGHNKD